MRVCRRSLERKGLSHSNPCALNHLTTSTLPLFIASKNSVSVSESHLVVNEPYKDREVA